MGLPIPQKSNAEYTALLEKLNDIPTLPQVAMCVNELINDPHSSSSDIAEVLKRDQVLTAKILKLANSSYYAIPGGCTDVQRALAFLGFNTLAQLVLGLSVMGVFKEVQVPQFSMTDFWRHALGTAVCSETIAKTIKYSRPEEAFTCGLLHDIGKLVLHEIDKPRLHAIAVETERTGKSFVDIEREWDLPGHSFLGEVIATKWGLPQVIRLAIRYHHFDVRSMDTILSSSKPAIQIVRLANQICVKEKIGRSGDCSEGVIAQDFTQPLGIQEEEIAGLIERFQKNMERAGAFFSVTR